MKRLFNKQLTTLFISCSMLITPITVFADSLNTDSEIIQTEFTIENIDSDRKEDNYSIGGDLDWFSQVQYIFPREGDAVVTDVLTGKSFNLKRTYGTNHADVEPLTKEDAEIIKDIWGGWSWERRAVVVNSNNTIIAGSMTAFPHAGVDNAPAVQVVNNRSGNYGRGQNLDSVKANGVDGHMDIHFLNSKTHGTKVVQKVHQDKVREAADYINKNY